MRDGNEWELFDARGRRKYLTLAERARFKAAAEAAPLPHRDFALTLHYTGCRISEALALTPDHIDVAEGHLVIRSLKKRRRTQFRAAPAPEMLLAALPVSAASSTERLWPWGRTTGWRIVKELMAAAEISGLQASPKGIRHGFGVAAALAAVPPTLIQRWMGHARLETTGVYLNVFGAEERQLANRLWDFEKEQNRPHNLKRS